MNRKGFTLIEVLAVVVILGIIFVFAAPNILTVYENSRLKSEEIFTERLSQSIDDYIKLNIDELSFNTSPFSASKSHKIIADGGIIEINEYQVTVNKGTISVETLINSKLIKVEDYINAGNKGVACNINAEIEIYRDSDFVYCHKVDKNALGCLTDKYKESIIENYVIDTCVWEVTS